MIYCNLSMETDYQSFELFGLFYFIKIKSGRHKNRLYTSFIKGCCLVHTEELSGKSLSVCVHTEYVLHI